MKITPKRPVQKLGNTSLNQQLPFPKSQNIIATGTAEVTPTHPEIANTKDNKAVIFSLAPLNKDQIKTYAHEKGVQSVDELINAIERSNTESFAARPRDLDGIISSWISTRNIGSKLDVMKANIKRRTEEVDPNRDQLNPLSNQKVMKGIKTVAAICTLTPYSRIAVPDRDQQTNAASIKEVLPEWSPAELLALLQRPIFDDIAYGTVRFHDRDIREYLTSEWIRDLLQTGSRREVEALFFQTQYDIEVTRPKLREVLSWVALFDDKIRERTLRVSPAALLTGGDPAKFPPEFRIKTLKATCKEMAEDDSLRYSFDSDALERFSDKNIEETVTKLFSQHKDNEDVIKLLLRMIWQGELSACKEEALNIALSESSEKYTRIYALRACAAVCNGYEVDNIIDYFAVSENGKNREIVSVLIDNFSHEICPEKLISIVNQLLPPEPYSSDSLKYSLEQLANIPSRLKLEALFAGFAELVSQEPHIDRRHCKVSQQYKWLLQTVSNIAEKLIKKRSKVLLSQLGLEALSKCATFKDSGYSDSFESKLSTLVPSWEELNYLSFWYDAARARKHWERGVTHEFQVGAFGQLWDLSNISMTQALKWVKDKPDKDDKLIALSVAFRLYKEGKRKPAERKKIKTICNGHEFLEQALQKHLHPPAMSDEEKKYHRSIRYQKKRRSAYKEKQESNLNSWRASAAANIDRVGYIDESGEGKTYPVQGVLFKRMRKNEPNNGKWTNTNWKYLVEDQNPAVAETFKDFLIATWKHNTPQLRSEAGEGDNSTSYSVIYGLSGLGILAAENQNWTSEISKEEAELACRYAIKEMNGPPDWLEGLHHAYPDVVEQIFFREIQWELFTYQGDKAPHYVLDKLSWHCKWMGPELTTLVFQELTSKEPRFEESLRTCLGIVLGSGLISDEALAGLATSKLENQDIKHHYLWFTILISVLPTEGISRLQEFLKVLEDENEATEFAMKFIVNLVGTRRKDVTQNIKENYKTVKHLQDLYMLMNEYIHMSEDIDRSGGGCYSPGLRDDAQEARSFLFTELTKIPGKKSYLALKGLSSEHPHEKARNWMENNARTHLENEADLPEWSVDSVLDFAAIQECRPNRPKELFDIAKARLFDLKNDLEHADDSVAGSWVKEDKETKLRVLIANWLRQCAHNNYSVHQEEEQADGKKPDIRLNSESFDAPVPIELKIADNWTGTELAERLENQLCNDYLRDSRTNFGVFLLVYRGENKSTWELPNRINFDEVVKVLQSHARAYIENRSDIEGVEVIGIDLTKRSIPNRKEES